ncbi:MFS transporter [bacterium]|nr:MFS transporter [bacterium]
MEHLKKRLNDSAVMRWSALLLLSGLLFATYWFNDCLGPLKGLIETELGFDNNMFGTVLASVSWANMALMIIVGGIALDRWGTRKTGIVFGSIATTGAFIMAFASNGLFGQDKHSMMIGMIVGRILFGMGLETVCVMTNRTIVKWFKGHELALAMAINVAIGRLGTAGCNFFGIEVAGGSVYKGIVFGASLIGLAVIMFLIYLVFDVKYERREKELGNPVDGESGDEFKLKDLKDLLTNPSFLYIAFLCVSFYAAVFPFIQYAPDLLINKFGFTNTMPDLTGASLWDKIYAFFHTAPKVTSLIPLGTILFTPVFGNIVDKKGRAASLMIVGSLLLIFAHLSLSVFNSVSLGYLGLFSLGIAFSLVPAAMWPATSKIVPLKRLGTAYATMFTIQNYGLSAFFWGIGKMVNVMNPKIVTQIQSTRDQLLADGVSRMDIPGRIDALKASGVIPPYNYTIPILMLVALGVISIFLAYLLLRADKKQGYGLELPSNH